MTAVLGVDVGGTKLLAHLVDGDRRIVRTWRRATGRDYGPERLQADLRELVSEAGDVAAVGFGFPGLVDHARGVVRSSIMVDGWSDVPLAQRIEDELGLPCAVDNDVNAAAIAELEARAGACRSMVFVAVGTGIGGALVLDGRLWRGAAGLAGEIGNTSIDRHGPRCHCGRRGCLNTFASGSVIAGDDDADAAAESLGFGLANVLQLLNPELVVLGGGVAERGAAFLAAVERTCRAEAFDEIHAACRFELSRVGYGAAAVGAASLAFEVLSTSARRQPASSAARPSASR